MIRKFLHIAIIRNGRNNENRLLMFKILKNVFKRKEVESTLI